MHALKDYYVFVTGGYSTFSTSTSPLSSPCPSPRNSSPVPNYVNGNRKNGNIYESMMFDLHLNCEPALV